MVAWEKDTQLYLLWLCCLHRFVTNGAEKSGAEDEVAEGVERQKETSCTFASCYYHRWLIELNARLYSQCRAAVAAIASSTSCAIISVEFNFFRVVCLLILIVLFLWSGRVVIPETRCTGWCVYSLVLGPSRQQHYHRSRR